MLPSYLLDGIKLSHLIAQYNNLTDVEQDAFLTTPADPLVSIDLSFNQLNKVDVFLRSLFLVEKNSGIKSCVG